MEKKMRILFTGDSITDAYRTDVLRAIDPWLRSGEVSREAKDGIINSVLGEGYPVMAAGQLCAEYPGKYEVINRGISGHRIVDLDARVKKDCINLAPDVVSIMIGINDVWHEIDEKNGVDHEKFLRVYDSMLSEIKTALPDVKFILIEPYVLKGLSTETNWEYFRKETDLRRAVVELLAKKYNAVFMETQKLFDEAAEKSCAENFSRDGVHPIPAGNWLLAREWVRLFKENFI